MRSCFIVALIACVMAPFARTAVAQDAIFSQQENVVFGEAHGVGLLMDVFTPKGEKNGLGIVDVISGAWHSDRGKIRDHARAQIFEILCRKGYTVFAVRPGSISKFSALEMLANLNQGIGCVKEHSKNYGIDPSRLGLMGASAGGHLACLAAVTANRSRQPAASCGGTSTTGISRSCSIPAAAMTWRARSASGPASSVSVPASGLRSSSMARRSTSATMSFPRQD